MRIVCISDTHTYGRQFDPLPEGDILVHAGDLTFRGYRSEVYKELNWLEEQHDKYKLIIVVPGNHDFYFENHPHQAQKDCNAAGIVLLNDSRYEYNDIKFWGSPITPWFHDWAFNRNRGPKIQEHWDLIPEDTDVLITHGPPYDILDLCRNGNVGCFNLAERINIIKPKLHVFGHIHESAGQIEKDGIIYVNASMLDGFYNWHGKEPIVIEI